MSEIRQDDQTITDSGVTQTASEEAGAVSAKPPKIDTIAVALNKKDAINPELNLKGDVDKSPLLNLSKSVEEKPVSAEMVAPENAGIVQSIGHQLKSARMARGLSVENVSRQLKISVQQIEAIEQEDFGKLPGRMFLRGFIRNYSNFLQLDSEAILKQLPPSQSQSASVNTHSQFQSRDMSFTSRKAWSSYEHTHNRGQSFLLKALLLFLLLMIIFALYQSVNWGQFSLFNKENNMASSSLEIDAQSEQGLLELDLPLPPPPVFPILDQDVTQLEPVSDIEPFEDRVTSTAQSPELLDVVTNSTDTESGVLHFRFRAESWVAVKDHTDEIIFEQLNAAGTEQIIDGKRPLSLVIGNADEVNLTYNDRAIDLAPYTNKIKGVARFTLE